jgi:RNA polymerase subunit RPABC4/transcription elongation factor Spt4
MPQYPLSRRDPPEDFGDDDFSRDENITDGVVDDESDLDPEGPDPAEMDSGDDPDLDVCPHCRKLIYEDAERCPHCGKYLRAEDEPVSIVGWIVIGIIVLIVAAFLLWRM